MNCFFLIFFCITQACQQQQPLSPHLMYNGSSSHMTAEEISKSRLSSLAFNYRSNNSSPLLANKSLLQNTPKTPSNSFGQPQQSTESAVWSNNSSSANFNRYNNTNNNTTNYYRPTNYGTETPPPSASSLRTPLSVLTQTANLNNESKTKFDYMSPKLTQMMSSSYSSNRAQPLVDHQAFQTESMRYLNSATFLSPAQRQHQTNTKFSAFSKVANNVAANHSGLGNANMLVQSNYTDFGRIG